MKILYVTLISFFISLSSGAQTTFNITYTGFTPKAQSAFQYAATIWSNTIESAVPIKVIAHFQPLNPGMLGITFPNGRKNFPGAPLTDTWYVTSLANALSGAELNPGEADIEIYLNSTQSWYFDTTGIGNCSQYDFVTVALHELGHGLGILSVAKKSSSAGSFGLIFASDFAPLTTSFPWPSLDTLPSVFDRMLVNELNQRLDTFPNPSNALGTQFTGNAIFITGPATLSANSGSPARIYAPGTYALGSSITHLNEATYPAGNVNELMTPNGTACYALHSPGPIVNAILQDMGWKLNTTGIHENDVSAHQFNVFPNPFRNELFIKSVSAFFGGSAEFSLYDVAGKEILRQRIIDEGTQIHTENIADGCYWVYIFDGKRTENFMIIKQ